MSIHDNITRILATRRPVSDKIAGVKTNLGSLYSLLNELENKKELLQNELADEDEGIIANLNKLNFSNLQAAIMNQLEVLGKVQTRFDRDTLNLAVVANAKQGKSRLLRSLTGLSENEIPDGNQGHCTGVASTVKPNRDSSETYGEVWFHTPDSFVTEVIAPYYKELGLGAVPNTIGEFKKPLPLLSPELAKNTNTIYQEKYRYLERYHTNLGKYEHLLGITSSQPQRINNSDIRKYVAQYDLNGSPTYDYMAVKKCDIFCPFPNAPTDKIAVVDTQGLGDTGVGDKERLIEILGKSVDIILFIKMPNPVADYWGTSDIELYSVANTALANHLPLEKWSFFVLNQTNDPERGNNTLQCDVLKKEVPETIKVIGDNMIIANCADEQQARDIILKPIVNYLVGNVEALDKEYSASYQEELNQLQNQVSFELEKASNSLVTQSQEEDDDQLFEELFEEFWGKLTIRIDELIYNLREESEEEDYFFQEQVELVIETAKNNTAIPLDKSENETAISQIVREIIKSKGDPDTAYSNFLNKVRTNLTRHFYALDDGLNRAIEQAKIDVAKLFVEELGFGDLTDKRGAEFIQAMFELFPEQALRGQSSQLKQGFQVFSEYKLSFKGLILPRIRPCLKPLQSFPRAINLEATERLDAAEQILGNLETLHGEVIYQCKDVLGNMLTEPVQAALAIVEEFQEQVIFSERIKTEWRLFLRKERKRIWANEFGGGGANKSKKEWQDLLERAKLSNSLDNFQFIK